ncbi:MAG TPA: Rne/Rng family ribonuclease [Bryobacteraceae bacterium]|nr:Rne/Rng family ribonuclease [Bryobacteraceae bacterium]
MTKEMVISANRHETKVAILEDDQLVEVYFQRANEYSLAGSIHKGRVTRVLPGMQSAFVDLGLERDTFLYVSDFFEENEEYDRIPIAGERNERSERGERGDRSDRGRREDRVQPPPKEVPQEVAAAPLAELEVEEPEVEAPVEAAAVPVPHVVPVAPVPPVGEAAPPAERPEFDRDRRRRSRRRRNRGRGFPESKYASPEREHAAAPAPEPVEEAPETGEDFTVLPGESLAKYHHTAVSTLDEGEQEELGVASAAEEHSIDQAMTEPEPVSEAAHEEAAEPEPEPELEVTASVIAESTPQELASSEQAHEAAEIAELMEEVREDVKAETLEEPAIQEPVSQEHEGVAEEPVAAAAEQTAAEDVAPSAEEALAEAAEAEEINAEEPDLEDETDADAEALEAAELVAALEERAAEAAAAEAGEHHSESGQANAPASAAVREQGGRYMHRVSRRLRRKMRGQGGGQGRPEHEPRREREPEAAAAAQPEPPKAESRSVARPEKGAPLITDLLKEGQEILVQIAKEPLGQKGARITSHIALPGRYVVYMPTLEHMGVSRKIASDEERARLKKILQAHRQGISGGFIVRTAGEGKSEDDIASDMNFLYNLWMDIRQKAEKKPAPLLLHHDLDIVQRLLRDQLTESFKSVWVDNEDMYESVLRFAQRFQPTLVSRIKLYTRPAPIFDAFNVTAELEKALRPKVWLKSGGYIVINQTEALVAIDVNTGKYVGKSNRLEDTIVKTNTEAVKEIVRQVRLRDLGGIIVVDFIDMDERKNRQKVMQALEEAMRADKAPYKILQFNDFGLVAITRKRVKQSLERALCAPCAYCEGAGYVKSVQTVIGEILQEAHKIVKAVDGDNVMLRVHPDVAKTLKSNQNHYLEELEEILRRPVLVRGDPALHHEKFDLA